MNTKILVIILTTLLILIIIYQGANSFIIRNNNPITINDMLNAQKNWGNALVAISTAYNKHGIQAAEKIANQALDTAYGYNLGPVLFTPTLTSGAYTFRPTREGALAYFIGQNPNFPDTGFALNGWRSVETNTVAYIIERDIALWMGNVYLTNTNGEVIAVDKTWGYKRDNNGNLRIVLHHSSLPYKPQ
jgi:hypothetical protein